MKVIIAEKPSVGRKYADVLGAKKKKNGYIEGNGWIVTWSFGHLCTLCYPESYGEEYKKWTLDTLPFIPAKYKYMVIQNVKEQFDIVKKIYNGKVAPIDAIYYAGDSGREGLYIQMLIRQLAGHTPNIAEKVVWIDSQTDEEILRGVREAKDISFYKNMKDSGYARAIEDFAMGINFSRVLTILYGYMLNQAAKNAKQKPIAVGRVMTCVLGMIVDREREIRNFKPTPFYKVISKISNQKGEVEGEWKAVEGTPYYGSELLYSECGFLREEDAVKMMQALPGKITISGVEKRQDKKFAPLLFNLAELQGTCSKKFHISPAETLNVAQSLYEKNLTTYPRTDARVLTNAVSKEAGKVLGGLQKNNSYGQFINEIKSNGYYIGKKYINDSQVTDHYAIIPTGVPAKELNDLEAAVYDLIVRRFLAIFFPPAIYYKISVDEKAGNEHFFANGKLLKEPGYLKVSGIEKGEDEEHNDAVFYLNQGEEYNATYEIRKGETKPPAHYTSGSMILAMENAGKLIEDEELRAQIKTCGIGTSATRAEVIEKLCRLDYIFLNKKTQVLGPKPFGEMVYELVKLTIPSLLSPEMTASWEKGLSQIVDGNVTYEKFITLLNNYIVQQTNKAKGDDQSMKLKERIKPFATGSMDAKFGEQQTFVKKDKYSGKNWDGEEVSFNKTFGTHTFTEEEAQKLLQGEEISIKLKGKKGYYTVKGSLKKQKYKGREYWGFSVPDFENKKEKKSGGKKHV